ncbi:MAG: cytochrome c [Exiguobacterium profundum]|nr:MAG: cytochrome c [Exiguobacterium profundum]
MKIISRTLIAAIALATASVAFAEGEPSDPHVIAWEELMKKNGGAVKVLADMVGGKAAFDAAAAATAKEALIAASAAIPDTFKDQATDPASEAKPEIWTNWDDFVAKANALTTAATALDVASVDTLKVSMGAIGGACKDCHTTYRLAD